MTSRRVFGWFYRLRFTPWDGQPAPPNLCALIEGTADAPALTPSTALDVGCGTGQIAAYLAQHGWRVTGVDFVDQPLRAARDRAAAAGVDVDFVRADVTRLAADGVGGGFGLIVDAGCLHNMPARPRDDYAREITAAAAPGALLFVVGFPPKNPARGAGRHRQRTAATPFAVLEAALAGGTLHRAGVASGLPAGADRRPELNAARTANTSTPPPH